MILKLIKHLLLFLLLTIITQIGGIVYLVFLNLNKKSFSKLKSVLLFFAVYILATFVIVPNIAPFFGREKVTHKNNIKPTNFATVILNRNYVKPKLNKLLQNTAIELKSDAIEIRYLDANFPFMDKFPLMPHLSHNDGKKIDVSFVYQSENGKVTAKQKSISGYGVFEKPKPTEINQINNCLNKGYWQYDYAKYMTFGKVNSDLIFSKTATKQLINTLLKQPNIQKIFIEPHLKQRLRLSNSKIRYHGCQAVRHDDHIHIQIN